jgi:hypothetical protein
MRRCTTKEVTIMARLVVAGMAVCAALTVCAAQVPCMARTALTLSSLTANGGALDDCMHVTR